MVDNFSFILDKCVKRAFMSLSLTHACSMFATITNVLQEEVLKAFKARFFILSGLVKEERFQSSVD